jgi:hypothetical protein
MSELSNDDNEFVNQKNLLNDPTNPKQGDNPSPEYYTQQQVDDILSEYYSQQQVDNIISSIDVRPYKVYTAILSQGGTNNPSVVSVLENTLGVNITWTRAFTGVYTTQNLPLVFPDLTKVWLSCVMNNTELQSQERNIIGDYQANNSNCVGFAVFNSAWQPVDNIGKAYIEIRVYE